MRANMVHADIERMRILGLFTSTVNRLFAFIVRSRGGVRNAQN